MSNLDVVNETRNLPWALPSGFVTCKDCQHAVPYLDTDKLFCYMYDLHDPDWFCADGERGENE